MAARAERLPGRQTRRRRGTADDPGRIPLRRRRCLARDEHAPGPAHEQAGRGRPPRSPLRPSAAAGSSGRTTTGRTRRSRRRGRSWWATTSPRRSSPPTGATRHRAARQRSARGRWTGRRSRSGGATPPRPVRLGAGGSTSVPERTRSGRSRSTSTRRPRAGRKRSRSRPSPAGRDRTACRGE